MQHHRYRLGHFMAGLGLALASLSASADFSGDITVKLLAPGGTVSDSTPFTLTQTVNAADLADGVRAANLGGLGDISGFMLDDERIFFSGNSILLRVAAGATVSGSLVTGYLPSGFDPARYEITGLAIPGQLITGYTVSAFDGFSTSGSTGLLAPAQASDLVFLFNGNAASVNLDSIVFVNRFAGESDNYAEFRIDLITTHVPEPAIAVLLLAGGVWLRLRRP